ncbi:MAG: hypothetical protein ABFC12_01905 [Methanobacterium sp.]
MLPYWLLIIYFDVAYRADSGAGFAAHAVSTRMVTPVYEGYNFTNSKI